MLAWHAGVGLRGPLPRLRCTAKQWSAPLANGRLCGEKDGPADPHAECRAKIIELQVRTVRLHLSD